VRLLDLILKRGPTRPAGTDLLALASVSPETVELLSDDELRRLEKLCHDSLEIREEEEMQSSLLVTPQGISVTKAVEISNRSWESVDKTKLPRPCWLINDSENRSEWKLPVYEGTGPKDEEGRFTQRGPLNANAVRAARAAVGGARVGKPMSISTSVRSRLEELMKLVQRRAEE